MTVVLDHPGSIGKDPLMRLEDLGWGPILAYHAAEVGEPGLVPGRLATVDRGLAVVLTETGAMAARWRYPVPIVGESTGVMPAVGDWAMISTSGEAGSLATLLPRHTLLARGVAAGARVAQPLAANVDLVLVVTGLDGDFSPRRIERYLALARSSGVRATILLNKSDLAENPDGAVRRARKAAPAQEILAVSAVTGDGVEQLRAEIGPGHTVVLVGSSGVGKSSLINRMLGENRQRTGAVRRSDDRGRHITTRRQLLRLPDNGLVIDTPGLREVGLLADRDAVLEVFPEIKTLARGCRFSDCRHHQEPDCAVQQAIREGYLDTDRLSSYHRLVREQISADRRAHEHERRAHERATAGHYRRYLREAHRLKGRE